MRTIQKIVCLSGICLLAANAHSQIVNGSFENGFAGWEVTPGCFIIGTPDVQPIGTHGQVCADLGGGDISGAVLSQTFPCNPNTDYELTFSSLCNSEPVNDLTKMTQWQVVITDDAKLLAKKTFKQKNAGAPGGSFGFVTRSVTFHSGPNTIFATVSFVDTTPNGGHHIDTGLDQVQVHPVRSGANYIVNASFERNFDGWDINSGCFIIGMNPNLPIGTDGFLCADLGGGDIMGAVLSQTINIKQPGRYQLDFDSASVVPDQPFGLAVWDVVVLADGAEIMHSSFSQTNNGVVHGNVGFVHRTMKFSLPANIQDVTVQFEDTTPGGGVAVDSGFDKVAVRRVNR
jgi:hypothetical protein